MNPLTEPSSMLKSDQFGATALKLLDALRDAIMYTDVYSPSAARSNSLSQIAATLGDVEIELKATLTIQ